MRMQVHLLVLDRAPQPLDEHVVAPPALAVYRHGDALIREQPAGGRIRKLLALADVEIVGRAVSTRHITARSASRTGFAWAESRLMFTGCAWRRIGRCVAAIDRRFRCRLLAAEHVRRSGEQLVLPVCDLVRVYVMLLRQFGQRLVASNGG